MSLTKDGMAEKVGAAIALALTVSVLAQLFLRGKGREKMAGDLSQGLSQPDRYDQQVLGRY